MPSGWYDHRRSGYQAPKSPALHLPFAQTYLPVGPASHTSQRSLHCTQATETRNRLWLARVSSPVTGLCHPPPHRHPGQHLPGPACGLEGLPAPQARVPGHACMLGAAWGWGVGRGGLSTLPPWAYIGLPRLAAPQPILFSAKDHVAPEVSGFWGLPLPQPMVL